MNGKGDAAADPKITRDREGKLRMTPEDRPVILRPDAPFAQFAGRPEELFNGDVFNAMLDKGYHFQQYVIQTPDFVIALFAHAETLLRIARQSSPRIAT